MAEYESQRIDRSSISDLTDLISAFTRMGEKQETHRRAGVVNMYEDFSKGAGSFDNKDVQYNLDRMEQYYSDNVSNMDADEIDLHTMLKDKYERQIETNNQFDADNQRRYSFGIDMMNFADEYSNADSTRNFSWKTSIIGDDGKMTDQDHIVELPNPEDYEGGENNLEFQKANNKAIADLGGLDGYTKKREEYKRYLKNQIQKQIGAYSDYQEIMIKKHGASGRLNNYHLKEFAELDESYAFIIDSIEDDGLFDEEERAVYQSAIMQKSAKPIEQFIAKDNELKSSNRAQLLKDMQILKADGDTYQSHLEAVTFAGIAATDEELLEPAITLKKNTRYNNTEADITYNNGDIKAVLADPSSDSALYSYLTSIDDNIKITKKELRNKDATYMKNDGGSFLSGMEAETWTSNLHDEPQGYMPTVYGEPKPDLPKDTTISTVSSDLGIKTIDIDKDISTVKSWATPELKKTGEKLNQLQLEIDNYEYDGYGSGNLRKVLGKKDKAPISYNELNQLEVSYNSDVEEMNLLNAEYKKMIEFGIKKNDPRRGKLEAKINQLYYKWTNATWNRKSILGSLEEELKGGRFKFSQSTPFEALKFAKNRLISKTKEYERLNTKYINDLKRSQK